MPEDYYPDADEAEGKPEAEGSPKEVKADNTVLIPRSIAKGIEVGDTITLKAVHEYEGEVAFVLAGEGEGEGEDEGEGELPGEEEFAAVEKGAYA